MNFFCFSYMITVIAGYIYLHIQSRKMRKQYLQGDNYEKQ